MNGSKFATTKLVQQLTTTLFNNTKFQSPISLFVILKVKSKPFSLALSLSLSLSLSLASSSGNYSTPNVYL
nr:hypothetical protein CFP56_45795 [Quercus suber]